jgi:hypothetical protein
MKKSFTSASDLDGFDDLKEEDQDRVEAAWETGKVAPEDVPESAKKPAVSGDEEEEKPKKKKVAPKKKKVSCLVWYGVLSAC